MDKVVFLDRDGTINVEKNYLYRPEELLFLSGVPEAIGRLNENGYLVVVVTNQAGVARGYYTEEDVKQLHQYMNEQLKKAGAHIDRFFYCPHHPLHGVGPYQTECGCRKPNPGMLRMAEQYYHVDKAASFMVGDNAGDIGAGSRYGVRTILVGTGYGQEIKKEGKTAYDYYAEALPEAVELIIREGRK